MPQTAVIYHQKYSDYNFGARHPLKAWRWQLAFQLMSSTGLLDSGNVEIVEPYSASTGDLLLFHKPEYVNLVKRLSDAGEGLLDAGDTPAFAGCFDAARLIAGGSMKAADYIMNRDAEVAFNFGGGFHHAYPTRASGFCIFNDIGVCIAYLRKRYGITRILYVDIDAHHGDGVMYSFYTDPEILDIDFHESGRFLFPGTGFEDEIGADAGRGYKVNFPMPPSCFDEVYVETFQQFVPNLARVFKPQIILLQCGIDAHFDDQLAHLALTSKAYLAIVSMLRKLAQELCGGRMIMFGGGGYNTSNVARCWTLMLAEVADIRVDGRIPAAWAEAYRRVEDEDPPVVLHDDVVDVGSRDAVVRKEVVDIREKVRKLVFPVHGLSV